MASVVTYQRGHYRCLFRSDDETPRQQQQQQASSRDGGGSSRWLFFDSMFERKHDIDVRGIRATAKGGAYNIPRVVQADMSLVTHLAACPSSRSVWQEAMRSATFSTWFNMAKERDDALATLDLVLNQTYVLVYEPMSGGGGTSTSSQLNLALPEAGCTVEKLLRGLRDNSGSWTRAHASLVPRPTSTADTASGRGRDSVTLPGLLPATTPGLARGTTGGTTALKPGDVTPPCTCTRRGADGVTRRCGHMICRSCSIALLEACHEDVQKGVVSLSSKCPTCLKITSTALSDLLQCAADEVVRHVPPQPRAGSRPPPSTSFRR